AWQLYMTFFLVYFAASLLAAAIDLLAPDGQIRNLKTSAKHRSDILVVYKQSLPLTAFNIFVTAPTAVVLLRPLIHPLDHFTYIGLWRLPVLYVMTDACFYISHRVLHTRRFFRLHRIHHRFPAPVGLAALYAHPLEVVFGNILSVILPPIVL